VSFTRFEPRALRSLGVRECRGYRLKTYSITYDNVEFRSQAFEAGLREGERDLPTPSQNAQRPGVGFVIMYQGRTGDYLILAWWDRENELPIRVFVRECASWRPATGGESVCVWDLRVIWWEREAYVGSVLSGGSVDHYLATTISGFA